MVHSIIAAIPPWLAVAGGGVLGALAGSFLGAAAVRLPAGRPVASGRSACDSCGSRLAPGELVPIVAFLVRRGRCRRCKAPIDPIQFAAEAGGAAIGAIAVVVTGTGWLAVWAMLLGWQLLLLGLLDVRHMWLPDRLVAPLAATGLAFGWWSHGEPAALAGETLAGGLLGFGSLWLVAAAYRRLRGRDGLGAGDPKLLGAIGLWVGPVGVVATLLAGSLIGLAGAAMLALGGRQVGAQTALPLGSALALAGWLVWLLRGG